MLWFLIVLAITLLGFLCAWLCGTYDEIGAGVLGTILGVLGGLALVIMICCSISAHIDTDAYVAAMQQRREVLVYQLENNVYENDNDIGKRDLYEQVCEWNEDLAKRKECQDSAWTGMFYADIYDQFELIPLK